MAQGLFRLHSALPVRISLPPSLRGYCSAAGSQKAGWVPHIFLDPQFVSAASAQSVCLQTSKETVLAKQREVEWEPNQQSQRTDSVLLRAESVTSLQRLCDCRLSFIETLGAASKMKN